MRVAYFTILLLFMFVHSSEQGCVTDKNKWTVTCSGNWMYKGYGISELSFRIDRCSSPEVFYELLIVELVRFCRILRYWRTTHSHFELSQLCEEDFSPQLKKTETFHYLEMSWRGFISPWNISLSRELLFNLTSDSSLLLINLHQSYIGFSRSLSSDPWHDHYRR